MPRIYFIGIGGIGMSGLARYLKAQGCAVSGSDSSSSIITDALRKESITVKIGHRSANVDKKAALVVYNRAIPSNNPELVAARKLKIPTLPYADIVGRLTEEYLTVAITGSHGKSTTTALAALALVRGGLDPTVLIGTNLKEFGDKNLRIGKSPYLVLEADDYGAAFLVYSPFVSIVTNIDREHMDFYKTFSGVKRAFLKFIARTRGGGALILNRDDAPLYSLKPWIAAIAKQKGLLVVWYSINDPTARKLKKIIKIPGEHNLSNAMAAYELGDLLKVSKNKLALAIGSYNGAWRRMEYRGKFKIPNSPAVRSTALVYNDYGHHPTEIKATLKGFREKFPGAPLVCVFQPHQTKRLQVLFKEFVSAFTDSDILVLIPSYTVAGRDEKNSKYTSETLAAAIAKKYPKQKIYYLANPKKIKSSLAKIFAADLSFTGQSKVHGKNPVIVMMGAGDIIQYTDSLTG